MANVAVKAKTYPVFSYGSAIQGFNAHTWTRILSFSGIDSIKKKVKIRPLAGVLGSLQEGLGSKLPIRLPMQDHRPKLGEGLDQSPEWLLALHHYH